jgi:flagellar basal body-associated protein FliL
MPTKLKGMTSLVIAIIVAIVLIIAVAVGWYLYTNFLSATSQQARLMVVDARVFVNPQNNQFQKLRLVVSNPGPNDVAIASIELAGQIVQKQ